MPRLKDRVAETTTTTGTGTLTLGGARPGGFRTFSASFTNADTVYYCITNNVDWEVGIGTYNTGTLTRDTVLDSSNSGALVSWPAGSKDVFNDYVAGIAVTAGDSQTLTNKTISGGLVSNSVAFAASTNSQGSVAITQDFVVLTSSSASPGGVTLPAGAASKKVSVLNRSGSDVFLYPAAGGSIDAGAANAPVFVPNLTWMTFTATSATQWYSDDNYESRVRVIPKSGNYTAVAGDNGALVLMSGAGNILTLPDTGVVKAGYNLTLTNNGTAAHTINVAGASSDFIGGGSSLVVGPGQSVTLTVGAALTWVVHSVGSLGIGTNSVSLGGSYASGSESVAIGTGSTSTTYGAKANNAVAVGKQALSSASFSAVFGGNLNVASGSYSAVIGGYRGDTQGVIGKLVLGAPASPVSGGAQNGKSVLYASTTNATVTAMTSDGLAAGAANQIVLADNSTFQFRIQVVGMQSASQGINAAGYTFTGVVRRGSGAASTTLLSLSKSVDYESDTTWDCGVAVDTTNGGITVNVTGVAATNIRWVATSWTSEVIFA